VTYYRELAAMDEPADIGLDESDRPQVTFNLMGVKRVSATFLEELTTLCQALLSHRGEASGARLAADVDRMYRSLGDIEIEAFLDRPVVELVSDYQGSGR